MTDLATALTLIGDHAARLREQGVLELTVDGVTVKLAPSQPNVVMVDKPAVTPPVDPLNDPATFGLAPGSKLPGLDWEDFSQEAAAKLERDYGKPKRKGSH